jgi:transposase-like protein
MAEIIRCPRCGSTRVTRLGFVPTIAYGHRQRYRCTQGHTFYSKKDIYEKQ